MPTSPLVRAVLVFVIGLLALAAGAAAYVWTLPPKPAGYVSGSGTALVGGPFELVDQTGAVRRDADFRGQFMLVYFGYTYCPDVCPVSLTNMSTAVDMLGETDPALAGKVTPVFITIDPDRDDVAALAAYAEHFHPRLVALTGDMDQVEAAAKAYRVYFAKVQDDEASDYLVDHSAIIYLMGPDGAYLSHFPHNATPEEIVAGLRQRLTS